MKQLASLLAAGAAIVPALWFSAVPDAPSYCTADSHGGIAEYSVTRPNRLGQPQKLTFNASAQTSLCKTVASYPL